MIRYIPVESPAEEEGVSRTGFGLAVVGEDGRRVMVVEDISTDYTWVCRLGERLTRGQLAPIHLMDVLEDLL